MEYSLIHNGTLIDGNGNSPIDNAVILIKDNLVVYAGSEDSLKLPSDNIRRIDAEDGYLLPGFIDTHMHIMEEGFKLEENIFTPLSLYFYRAVKNMRLTIDAGVTTIRDAGLADFGVKSAVDQDLVIGPRMQISIMPLSISGGHFDQWLKSGFDVAISYPGLPESVCDGKEEVRKRVRQILRSGAEVVKVMVSGGVLSANDRPEDVQFSQEELKVIVEEAGYRGLRVMAHAHGAEGIKNALNAGIKSIEHGTYLDQEAIQLMLEKRAYLVPTLLVTKYNRNAALSGDLPDYSRDDAIRVADIHRKNMIKAYESGVDLVMGTDCGAISHGVNLQELGLLCELGMKPMEAIMAGTKKAAECLGWQDKIGTLETGKLADIVISRTDPLTDIDSLGNPENIRMVIKNGKVIKNLL